MGCSISRPWPLHVRGQAGSHVFDSTRIVPDSAAALRGLLTKWPIMAFCSIRQAYCPPLLVRFYKPLFKTLCLIGWSRETPLMPKSSCGPKVSKRSIFTDLLNNIHFRRLSTNLQNSFDWMEQGNAPPAKIILWTKGLQKVHLRRSPEQHPFPGAPRQPGGLDFRREEW